MVSPPAASTLADRLAGLSGDVALEAEQAWRLRRLVLEMLAHMLALLAGLAAQFAAGTLPAPQPQAIRPLHSPKRPILTGAVARWSHRARDGEGGIEREFP